MIHIQQQVWVTKESFEDEELAKKELALLNRRSTNSKRRTTYRLITNEWNLQHKNKHASDRSLQTRFYVT